jgi:hypothetical protein
MKRLLAILLASVFFLGSVGFAVDLSEDFAISHTVTAVSSAVYSVGISSMTAKVNKLGDVTISNNTLDGWSLSVLSANAGQFMNTTTANGEVPIDYNLDIEEVSGTLGDGMTLISSIDLGASASNICSVVSNQNSASSALKLAFQVDFSAQSTRFDMAGTYADILTITYGDL